MNQISPGRLKVCCSSSLFKEALTTALLTERFIPAHLNRWTILFDVPVGWAQIHMPSNQTMDCNDLIVVTQNSCPEYLLDVYANGVKHIWVIDDFDTLTEHFIRLGTSCSDSQIPHSIFTPAERTTIRLLAANFSNKHIAEFRKVTVGTVKNSLALIFAKLRISDRIEVSHYYFGRWELMNRRG